MAFKKMSFMYKCIADLTVINVVLERNRCATLSCLLNVSQQLLLNNSRGGMEINKKLCYFNKLQSRGDNLFSLCTEEPVQAT